MLAASLVVFRRYLIVVPKSLLRRPTLSQQEKNTYADVQRKEVNFTRVQLRITRVRVIMAAADCSPAKKNVSA
jgi:hypothetical protein